MIKRTRVLVVLGAVFVIALLTASAADESTARFDKLKALAGDWTMAGGDGSVAVSYRVTGAGSAVVETIFPGTAHEMVTMYTLNKGDIVLTHYCSMANQPRMRSTKGGSASSIAFKFDGGDNVVVAKDIHMHDMEMTFVDADHVKAAWHLYGGGKESEVKSFDLVRKMS